MSKIGNQNKHNLLGMNHGTASSRLKKKILFSCIVRLKENFCYRCGAEILTAEDTSVEHKDPWMQADDPKRSFFDLDNIAFSHLSCNIAAGSRPMKKYDTPQEVRDAFKQRSKEYRASLPVEVKKTRRRERYRRTGK